MSHWLKSTIKEIIVYRSISHNIFSNLALEDWMLHNVDHHNRRILLLWRNDPCVVIGRYQNPWVETDVAKLESTKTVLARRKSGGGAVYHDLGNLNCTLFTHRSDYNRLRNLQLVCDAVNGNWGAGLYVGERNDILCQGKKVSGSASRLGKDHTYHHFTLLIDVNTRNLHSLLKTNELMEFSSNNATASVPSSTINLQSVCDNTMTYSKVCTAIANKFYDEHQVNKKYHRIVEIDPSNEQTFPGISKIRKELETLEWIWNKTPNFTVQIGQTKVEVTHGMITNITPNTNGLQGTSFKSFLEKNIL